MGKHITAVNGAKYRNAPDSVIDQLLRRREPGPDGCWFWPGYIDRNGYGIIAYDVPGAGKRRQRQLMVHRIAYMRLVGDVADDEQVDHACHDPKVCKKRGRECLHRRCYNPEHLDAVPPAVNNERSSAPSAINAAKTHCVRNHEFTPENTHITPLGERRCKACARWHAANDRAAKRTAPIPVRVCRDCGADISHLPGHIWFCKQCEPTSRHARRQQEWAEKRDATRLCLDCGTDISDAHLNRIRCVPCQEASIRQRNKLARDKYRRKKRAEGGPWQQGSLFPQAS